MIIKNALKCILTKIQCNNKVLSDRLKLYSQSMHLVGNSNNYNYHYRNICQLHETNNYDSRIITNCNFNVKNGYRIKQIPNLINRFKILKLMWQHDPDFNLESYKRGTKQVSHN